MSRFFLFLIVQQFVILAQNVDAILVDGSINNHFWSDSNTKFSVKFGAKYHANSNYAISNSFLSDLMFRSELSSKSRRDVFGRLRDFNKFGFIGKQSADLSFKLSDKSAITLSVSNNDLLSSRFSDDLFKLAFDGNASFAGKNAVFDHNDIRFLNFQSIGITYNKFFKRQVFGVGINYVTSGRIENYQINKGQLFTAADGTYLDFNTNIRIASKGQDAPTRIFNNVGTGTSLNLSYTYRDQDEKMCFNATLDDFGYVKYDGVLTYEKDSSYHFEGVVVNDILNFDPGSIGQYKTDSLVSILNIQKKYKNEVILLPFSLNLALSYRVAPRWNLMSGIQYYYLNGFSPMTTLGTSYRFCSRFDLFTQISVGGFGRVDHHVGFNTILPGKIRLWAKANVVEFLISKPNTSGAHLNISLIRDF